MNERIIVQVVRLIFTWKMEVVIARVIDMFYVSEGKFDGMMMIMMMMMMMVVMMMMHNKLKFYFDIKTIVL